MKKEIKRFICAALALSLIIAGGSAKIKNFGTMITRLTGIRAVAEEIPYTAQEVTAESADNGIYSAPDSSAQQPVSADYIFYTGYNKNSDCVVQTDISVPASPGAEYSVSIGGDIPGAVKEASIAAVNQDSVKLGFIAARGVTDGTASLEIRQREPAEAVPATVYSVDASGNAAEKVEMVTPATEVFRTVAVLNVRFVTVRKTSSIRLNDGGKSVIADPGKKTTVRFLMKKSPEAFDPQSIDRVKIKNKKVVSNAEIKGTKGGKIVLKIPAKAEKGSCTAVKVFSGDRKFEFRVYVRNRALKVTAKKKNIKMKLGRTKKIRFKVKTENPKRLVADDLTAGWSDPEIAIAKKVISRKGKLAVKVTGLKKGKTKFRLHVGKKKSVYIKVRVR